MSKVGITNLDIEEGEYNAVRWNNKTREWNVTKVLVTRDYNYMYRIIITDINNRDKQPLRLSVSKFNMNVRVSNSEWLYSNTMTVKQLKQILINKKRAKVKEALDKYVSQKDTLREMEDHLQD